LQQPSLDNLMKQMDSKYELVIAASKRARMLTETSEDEEDGHSIKPVSIALDEIAKGVLWVEEKDLKR
jgi:DNA-directed RNA polymerase subunit omega